MLVLELDDDFDGDINDMSCFMLSTLTSITGYFEQTVLRYFPYEFKHRFRIDYE